MSFTPATDEMRSRAVARSVEVRRRRSAAKARLASGEVTIAEAIGRDEYADIRVYHLLLACPNIGHARAEKIMAEAGVPANRHVRGLGVRQRVALVELAERFIGGQGE